MSELLDQYVKDCLSTESKQEKLQLNLEVVSWLFIMFEDLSEILDGLKKYTFYGKPEKFSAMLRDKLKSIAAVAEYLSTRPESFLLSREESELNTRMFHGILGIMTEAGELAEIWSNHMSGEEFDPVHVQEELGDQQWYQAIIHDEMKLDPEETLHKNTRKLAKIRYKKGFSNEAAANRDLEAERKALES